MAYRLGCVVMAAGSSSRFGGNKLLREFRGVSFLRRTLDAVPQEAFVKCVVVTQYPELAAQARARGFTPIPNTAPEEGISRTVALGLSALGDTDGALFTVSDQPMLSEKTFRRVLDAWEPGKIAAAAANGVRGNPCLFPKELYPELLALSGDHGGASVIRRHEDLLILAETDATELWDCDTPKSLSDLEELLTARGGSAPEDR